jgi:hypothetical protein
VVDSASIGSGSRGIKCAGSKCISRELRDLVIQMVAENSSWSTLPIHGELNIPGFDISERKVLWIRKAPRNPENQGGNIVLDLLGGIEWHTRSLSIFIEQQVVD